jgi:hypothetical protein
MVTDENKTKFKISSTKIYFTAFLPIVNLSDKPMTNLLRGNMLFCIDIVR